MIRFFEISLIYRETCVATDAEYNNNCAQEDNKSPINRKNSGKYRSAQLSDHSDSSSTYGPIEPSSLSAIHKFNSHNHTVGIMSKYGMFYFELCANK